MSFTREQILELFRSEAAKHRERATCTIQDIRTRQLEIEALFLYLSNELKILDVGCGNGCVSQAIVENFDVEVDAIDLSSEMIAIAKNRQTSNLKGRVTFLEQNILTFKKEAYYDLAFSERCLQNLVSWDEQKMALANIANALKPKGELILLESFWTGLNKLNEARSELDLEEIKAPWHNLLFDEKKLKIYMSSLGYSYVGQNCFLSGYYFGSRVILPTLMPKGKTAESTSVLNDYFCGLPPHGDFAPMKILRFINGG